MTSRLFQGALLLALSCELITGCALNGNAGEAVRGVNSSGTATALSGRVHGGQNPVTGATIQIYQIGSTGYTSSATPLLNPSVTTDSNGNFTLASSFSCTPGTFLYATATGGNPGLSGANPNNPNLALANAIGLCDNLLSGSFIIINELTTVSAAYALSQFSSGTTFGTLMSAQPGSASSAPADNFATSSTNKIGLANAIATNVLLVNPATGISPNNNVTKTALPAWWQVNMIGDMLAACVNSAGGSANGFSPASGATNAPCATLFANVSTGGGPAPVDTLQAALYMAYHPTLSTTALGYLYSLVTSTSPFQSVPKTLASITDLTIGIQYRPLVAGTTATYLLNDPVGVSFDSLGNAWVVSQPVNSACAAAGASAATVQADCAAYLVELTPVGDPIQAGTTSGTYVLNSYFANGNSTSTPFGSYYALNGTTYAAGVTIIPAIDTNNNVWVSDRMNSAIVHIAGSGTTYSNTFAYTNGGNASATAFNLMASSYPNNPVVDGNNNVWFHLIGPASGALSSATCSTSLTSYNKGFAGFLAGSFSSPIYGGNNASGFGALGYIALDPGVRDTTTNGGTATPIPGGPFIWSAFTNQLEVNYSQSTGATNSQACQPTTAQLGYVGYTGDPTTTTPPGAPDPTTATGTSNMIDTPDPSGLAGYLHPFSNAYDIAMDKYGNLWTANTGAEGTNVASVATTATAVSGATTITVAKAASIFPGDTVATTATSTDFAGGTTVVSVSGLLVTLSTATTGVLANTAVTFTNPTYSANAIGASVSKITPTFGTAFTPAQFAASTTWKVFYGESGLVTGSTNYSNPRAIAVDGGGNVYFSQGHIGGISATGVALSFSPAVYTSGITPGFYGSQCLGCALPGTTTPTSNYFLFTSGSGKPVIDASGNLWFGEGSSTSTYVQEFVGLAVPKMTPDSLGLKNGNYASMP